MNTIQIPSRDHRIGTYPNFEIIYTYGECTPVDRDVWPMNQYPDVKFRVTMIVGYDGLERETVAYLSSRDSTYFDIRVVSDFPASSDPEITGVEDLKFTRSTMVDALEAIRNLVLWAKTWGAI